ncbi:trehalose-phosphatase [Gordonia phosphorivorans]|uniref:Trehalose 6-phosphate phosphatase n=1 Tax=Gordonia phosphorivorans TaxID=1056982 RepID=A0ABV6HCM3_9ACTN
MSAPELDADLRHALDEFCGRDRVLVASDYDGCIAPIQPRPDLAVPNPESLAALRECAERSHTLAAMVSGRARDDLAAMSGLTSAPASDLVLVGSHGAEFDTGFDQPITAEQQDLLNRIIDEFGSIARRFDGTSVETKPASTTLHVRNASPADATAALALAADGPAAWSGVHVTEGKAVVELAVIETSKGLALDRLRDQFGADAVLYLGDDVTDEKAFAHLHRGTDVGIKVGTGVTGAQFRVPTTDHVAAVLAYVAGHRN